MPMRFWQKIQKMLSGEDGKMTKEKYYICPNCGEFATETNLLEVCSNGGMPHCYCEFENGKVLIGYKNTEGFE